MAPATRASGAARPRVLFVGDDASSPEIAATLLRRLVGDQVVIRTAGAQRPDPGGRGDDILVQMGLNPATEERLSVSSLSVSERVVVLATGLDVARLPGRRYEEWDLDEEDLAEHVRRLAIELCGPARADGPGALARVRRGVGRLVGRLRRRG